MAEHSSEQQPVSVQTDTRMTDGTDNIEFRIVDTESMIVLVATTLARQLHFTSIDRFLVSPDRLTAFSPATRLRFLEMHLERLKQQVASETKSLPIASAPALQSQAPTTQALEILRAEKASKAQDGTLSADRETAQASEKQSLKAPEVDDPLLHVDPNAERRWVQGSRRAGGGRPHP